MGLMSPAVGRESIADDGRTPPAPLWVVEILIDMQAPGRQWPLNK
jgi:hypothetical protein